MGVFHSVIARHPGRELEIHRLCASNPQFRAICADFEEAAAALCHWQSKLPADDPKVTQYADLLHELNTEIVAHLSRRNADGSSTPSSN